MKVVYGHTDSIYVECESIDRAKEVCSFVNTTPRCFISDLVLTNEETSLINSDSVSIVDVNCVILIH